MENKISDQRIKRIRAQGYFNYTDQEISDLAFGNRFAYILCTAILGFGVATANIPIISAMLVIAFLGVILPNHPFDYIYNFVISEKMGKPQVPPRSKQLKFACTIATCMIAITIYLFYNGYNYAGYIFGGHLVAVATLVSTTDICVPSILYNHFFKENNSVEIN